MPKRRAESPQHFSSFPRIAKSTPAVRGNIKLPSPQRRDPPPNQPAWPVPDRRGCHRQPDGTEMLDRRRKNTISRGHPAQCDHIINLFDVPGASLRALAAGRTTPDLFTFDLRQTKCRLTDELAHTESPDLIPGTNRIAFSALIAEFEGLSTALSSITYLKGATVSMTISSFII